LIYYIIDMYGGDFSSSKELFMADIKSKAKTAADYFSASPTEAAIIVGIAVSGMASLINIYDAISGFDKKGQDCKESDDYKKASKIRFAILLTISILTIGLGMYLMTKKDHNKIIPLGVLTAGVFGFLYALSTGIKGAQTFMKTRMSLGAFAFFLVVGFYKGGVAMAKSGATGSSLPDAAVKGTAQFTRFYSGIY